MTFSPILARLATLAVLAAIAGCAGSEPATPPRTVFGGPRPATIYVPAAYDGTSARPLLVVLHGYGSRGLVHAAYLGATA